MEKARGGGLGETREQQPRGAGGGGGGHGFALGRKGNGPPWMTSAVLGVFGKLSRASAFQHPTTRPHGRTGTRLSPGLPAAHWASVLICFGSVAAAGCETSFWGPLVYHFIKINIFCEELR